MHPAILKTLRLRGDNRFLRQPDLLVPSASYKRPSETSPILAVVYVRRVLMFFPHADNKKQRQGWMLTPRVIGDSPRDRGRGHDTNLDAYPRDMEGETVC
ncbi:hypothetical protein LAZ67_2006085 [Cordylochernes scorpioides]|uniref:Uncharacterized protein n=1 Tax=Cordylochernes scorpioides TaxID=51811 RepID=A0ABY6K502_9ARAC|nr:hypothetical protein LAZ67_2006085 [Cordylochernes scorpioides]